MTTPISDEFMQSMLSTTREYTVVVLYAGAEYGRPDTQATVWEHGRRNFSLRADGRMPIVVPVLRVKGGATDEPLADAVDLPFVVIGDGAVPAYAPSGWMGERQSLTMDAASRERPHSGATCVKFAYSRLEGWCGVAWQDPANDWGDRAGGYELSGARTLSFWVRGARGGERVKFGFGMIGEDKKFFDTAKAEREVVLSQDWQRVEIRLGGKSLRRIKTGFWWTLGGQGMPVTFWLDDVRYE